MADVFMSYAREDRDVAEFIATALHGQGFSVWWDRKIRVGRSFSQTIEQELASAKCVVVLWSASSVASDWVASEAAEGVRRRILVPICIEDVSPPLEFRRLQSARILNHDRIEANDELPDCVAAIRALVQGTHIELPRPQKVTSAGIGRHRYFRYGSLAALALIAIVLVSLSWRRIPRSDNQNTTSIVEQSVIPTITATETTATRSSTGEIANPTPATADTSTTVAPPTAPETTDAATTTSFPFQPAEAFEYRYSSNGNDCRGYFLSDGSGRWVERTFGAGGCVETRYEFREQERQSDEALIYDSSRNYYLRIPLRGGQVMLATSRSGPWGGLHHIVLSR